MTNLNEAANMDWNGDMVSPNRAVVGSGIATWLTSVIHRIWDILDVDLDKLDKLDKMEGEDGDYYPYGGCCCV